MATPFISESRMIDLTGLARYVESTGAEQVGRDCGAWGADPRDAIVLGDVCRQMREQAAHARAFYAWSLDWLEEHPDAPREGLDLAARYYVLGSLCSRLSDTEGAMEAWAKSIDYGSDDPAPYVLLALALANAGRVQEARARIDGLFSLPPESLRCRLDAEQRRLAERLRTTLPVAHGGLEGQDLRTRVRDLLLVAERGYGSISGVAGRATQALR